MGDTKAQVGQIGGLIPQVFYDIIGRIVPGWILLVLAFLLFKPEGWQLSSVGVVLGDAEIPYGWLFWIGLPFSYIVGVILGAPGYWLSQREWGKKPSGVKVQVPDSSLPCAGDYDSYIYDIIQLSEPAAGARLVKLSAECNMCRVLIAGFVLLAACVFHPECNPPGRTKWLWILSLLVGAGFVRFFNRHVRIRSQHLMLNLWYRLVEEERVKPKIGNSPGRTGQPPINDCRAFTETGDCPEWHCRCQVLLCHGFRFCRVRLVVARVGIASVGSDVGGV